MMPNILSFKCGTCFWGREILQWCEEQIREHTSHEKEATRLWKRYGDTLKSEAIYSFYRGYERDRGPEVMMIRRMR